MPSQRGVATVRSQIEGRRAGERGGQAGIDLRSTVEIVQRSGLASVGPVSRARFQFLFGFDEAPVAVDDEDELAGWFAEDLSGGPRDATEPIRALMRVVVARHVLTDTPPVTWQTAQRLLDAGLDRSVVLDELTLAVMVEARRCLGDEGGRFDDERYAATLATLPLPTVAEIEDAVKRITSARRGIAIDELREGVLGALGREPLDELAAGIVGRVIEQQWADGGRLVLLADDVLVHLPSASAGAVLTHRVNESELELGVLSCAGTDLALFAWNEDLRVPSGEPIETFSVEPGHAGWLGPEGWLSAHAAGDLIEVRLVDGVVHIAPAAELAPDAALEGRLAGVHAHETEESGLPVTFLELAAALVLDDADTFVAPRPPLTELCERAGLEIDGGFVASGPDLWARHEWTRRLDRVYDGAEDAEEARAVLHALDVVEGEGATADLRSLLREFHDDPRRATLMLDELLDADLRHGDVDAARRAADRLVEVATRSADKACAHWFAALVEERAGSVLAADAHAHLASLEDPGWAPAADRAGWYASDRGDAATAARWWREVGSLDPRELAVVSRHAQRSAPKVGRNDPCWCGSGRKVKSCHQGRGDTPALPDRVEWLWMKAVGYLLRRGGEVTDDLYELTSARTLDPEDEDRVVEALHDPIVFDTALVEFGWFERFVHDRGALLPDDEAELAASWVEVERTVYEIEEVGAQGLVVRDLRTDERLTVEPPRDAATLAVGGFLCARAVPDGRGHQFVGARFPVALGDEDEVMALCDDADAEGLCEYVAGLSGSSPEGAEGPGARRHAAADSTHRADVARLLARFPMADPDAPFVTMDPGRIRDALGLWSALRDEG